MAFGTELVILVTILALLVYFWMAMKVGMARDKYGVKAPAITGNPDFERIFRVHQNTLEQLVMFLPGLWLFHMLFPGIWAGLLGLVWIAGRLIYARAYYKDAEKRGLGMMVTMLPTAILLLGALVSLILLSLHGGA